MTRFSRSERAQIIKRVRKAKFQFDKGWKCLLCGMRFNATDCAHTVAENEAMILEVQKMTDLPS